MKLRVLARGLAMVPHLESFDAGTKRFVGRKHDRTLGAAFRDENGQEHRQGGWPPGHHPAQPHELDDRAEYRQAVREGDLWAADEDTARACGVKFDPKFGSEYDPAPMPSPAVVAPAKS